MSPASACTGLFQVRRVRKPFPLSLYDTRHGLWTPPRPAARRRASRHAGRRACGCRGGRPHRDAAAPRTVPDALGEPLVGRYRGDALRIERVRALVGAVIGAGASSRSPSSRATRAGRQEGDGQAPVAPTTQSASGRTPGCRPGSRPARQFGEEVLVLLGDLPRVETAGVQPRCRAHPAPQLLVADERQERVTTAASRRPAPAARRPRPR